MYNWYTFFIKFIKAMNFIKKNMALMLLVLYSSKFSQAHKNYEHVCMITEAGKIIYSVQIYFGVGNVFNYSSCIHPLKYSHWFMRKLSPWYHSIYCAPRVDFIYQHVDVMNSDAVQVLWLLFREMCMLRKGCMIGFVVKNRQQALKITNYAVESIK